MWDRFVNAFIYFGMPVVAAYHLILGSSFLNISAQDATGLEKAGDLVLTPVHYLFCGKVAVPTSSTSFHQNLDTGLRQNPGIEIVEDGGSITGIQPPSLTTQSRGLSRNSSVKILMKRCTSQDSNEDHYKLIQQFDYSSYWAFKTTVSLISVPLSVPIGSLLKGISFLSKDTRLRHAKIVEALSSTKVSPNIELYRSLGIPISFDLESIDPPQHCRRPGEERVLPLEKALLQEIVQLFNENQIPYWVDCGTCLGAYRYGGVIPWDGDVDLAILAPDFQNALHALNHLDPEKYQVQDWSNRSLPGTYIRVYVKETRNHIDIYHFAINPVEKTCSSILSNEPSPFMTEAWKTRERRFTVVTAYDIIFPLKKAQFDGIEVCVPNQTKRYLQQRYGEDIGPVKIYNETTGEYEKDLSHPYWQIPHVY